MTRIRIAIVLAVLLVASVGRAQETSFDRLFADAMTLIGEERFEEAIPKLEEAQRLDPGIGTQFNLAACYEKVGRLADAWRHFSEVERNARAAGKKPREDAAHEMLNELATRVPHLAIHVAEVRDVTVRVDGRIVLVPELPFVVVDPGEHTVEAVGLAKQPFANTVTVEPGGREYVVEVPTLAAIAPRTEVRTVTRDATNVRRTLGVVFGGLGAAGAITAGVTGVMILSAHSTAEERCRPDCITPTGDVDTTGSDAVRRGKDLLPINIVAWVVAGAGLISGTFFLLTAARAQPKKQGQARFDWTVGSAGPSGAVSIAF